MDCKDMACENKEAKKDVYLQTKVKFEITSTKISSRNKTAHLQPEDI